MRLYSAALSLFARKVEIVLAEKGLPYERVMVPFSQAQGYSPKHPDVVAANPKRQVPVLQDGDLWLYDSTVIVEYLEEAYPEPPLFPAAASERARCRLFDLLADEVLLVPVRALMHRTGPRPADPERWLASEAGALEAGGQIARHFAELDRQLEGKACFCNTFGAADIALFMPVFYSHRLGGPSLQDFPKLRRWYESLRERPAFARVVDEIMAADRDLSQLVEGAYS